VLVAGTLTNSKTVRIEPALNIPDKLIEQVLDAFEDTLREVDASTPDIKADEDE
jgi:acetylornithine/succinyldiaminopimelate/putrescine aminotransferase